MLTCVSGKSCFVCESDENIDGPDGEISGTCPNCVPTVILDSTTGQCILQHIGAHLLYDSKVDRASSPCGLCLRPSPMCQFFLKKGKGAKGSIKLNTAMSKGCPNLIKFSYSIAEKSTKSSPCSNVPIPCPLCSKSDPAVWLYNMGHHMKHLHLLAQVSKYKHIW